jgi:hypothetical protein
VTPQDRTARDDRYTIAILAVILTAAFALLLYRLNAGLWLDEIYTYIRFVQFPFGQITSIPDPQNQHFFYDLLARASFELFGETPWSLRLPAVLFGVGSIWALFLLGRQVSTAQEALLTAALFAFSYHHIWFSQNARGYTGLLFWSLLSTWLFLRALNGPKRGLWVAYAATVALGVYTIITMVFVNIGHFIVYLTRLVTRRKESWSNRWDGFFFGFCPAGLLSVILYAPVFTEFLAKTVGEEREGTTVEGWTSPIWTLLELAKGMQIGFAGGVLGVAALAVFILGFLNYSRTNPVVPQLLLISAAEVLFLCNGVRRAHRCARYYGAGTADVSTAGLSIDEVSMGRDGILHWVDSRLGHDDPLRLRSKARLCGSTCLR